MSSAKVDLPHLAPDGSAYMVDVGAKPDSERVAVAGGRVLMRPETLRAIQAGDVKKGDVLGVARIAGIMAAKRTADLIPLCHPLPLTHVSVELAFDETASAVVITATCKTYSKTGVEMEALSAVSAAALTIYDMAKTLDRAMTISDLRLLYKSGGQSGEYQADG
jgi:cyclic pyranopterin phosphate synthase